MHTYRAANAVVAAACVFHQKTSVGFPIVAQLTGGLRSSGHRRSSALEEPQGGNAVVAV